MAFLRNLLASILGVFIATGIMFFVFLMFISILSAGSGSDVVTVHNNSILELQFNKPLKDYGGRFLITDIDHSYENYDGMNHILEAIRAAKTDSKIKGISVYNTFLMGGMAQTKALRDALDDFKNSGKFVYAYSDIMLQKDYYLSSVADSIFLNPLGEMEFKGLSSEVLFFKDFQEKSGIKLEVVRHGKYKSAVEPYLENSMSDDNRLQIKELLQSLWNTMVADIAESRRVDIAHLNRIADELNARNPQLALASGLIDKIVYEDQYESALYLASDLSMDNKLNYINIYDYAEHVGHRPKITSGKNKIAVIYAEGEIIYGKGDKNFVGQGTISKSLREAAQDEQIKAIVLRVNSPGGSALASDIMWREVELAKAKKPVYVSMGNYAASGGYYIACGADKIFAEPNTITGSIGVFGILPNIKNLANRWGINAEQVNTHKNSQGFSLFESPSEGFISTTKESIENIYSTFLERVSAGRNLSIAEVDSIAQGRVWSGNTAKDIGLVDEIGGLSQTVKAIAEG